jgi:aryl-alcohol dehydrogenase-like predicted oxidoreductase
MKTDYLDLYYIHGPDPVTPLEESLRALDDLTRQGKIRYSGVSNFFGWQVAKAAGIAAYRDYGVLAAGQFLYNLIHREHEREVIPALVDSRMGLCCFSPLGAGLLTGKYRGMKDPAEGSRLAARMKVDGARFWHPRGFAVAECVEKAAAESGIPMSRLAIAWPLGRNFVTSVIIGVKDAAQLADNMALGDWDLPPETWSALEKATRPEEEYLTWFNKANFARSFGAAEHHDASRELP